MNKLKNFIGNDNIVLVSLFIALIVIFSFLSPYFLSFQNAQNLIINSAMIGIVALVETLVLIMGGLDISVGSVLALSGVVVAKFHEPLGVGGAILFAIGIGVLFGFINGLSITKLRVNPLIATIATMSIARGFAFVVNDGQTAAILDKKFGLIGRGSFFGVNNFIWYYLILFVIMYIVMKKTTYGRALYAIGGNEKASMLAGIKVRRIQLITYVLCATVSALAGIAQTSQMGAGAPQAGIGLEMSVIAAIILGGASLNGGRGTVVGTTIGVLLIGTLNNGLLLKSVSSDWQGIIMGSLMLFALAADQLRRKEA